HAICVMSCRTSVRSIGALRLRGTAVCGPGGRFKDSTGAAPDQDTHPFSHDARAAPAAGTMRAPDAAHDDVACEAGAGTPVERILRTRCSHPATEALCRIPRRPTT